MPGRRILITGVAGPIAGPLLDHLEQHPAVDRIVGVDVREPPSRRRMSFVRADVRNPLVAKALADERIDTVVHLSTAAAPRSAGGRPRMKERNVIGAMQLFAACQKLEHVRRVVLKSSTAVYGSDHTDPALFTEDHPVAGDATGFTRDAIEVEGYARALARRRGDLDLTILRFANFAGPRFDSAFAALFSLPVVPTVAGFDPRLQFCHESDGVAVLARATIDAPPGTYNVAGPGALYLSQCVRLAGSFSLPVPMPLVRGVSTALGRSRRVDFSPEQLRFLQFGRVADVARLMDRFGYRPRYDSRAAFEDLVATRRLGAVPGRAEIVRWVQLASEAAAAPVTPRPAEGG